MLARHENVNHRVNFFDSLSGTFRNDVSKHRVLFHAVVSMVQIVIEVGDKLPSLAKQSCKHFSNSTNAVLELLRMDLP